VALPTSLGFCLHSPARECNTRGVNLLRFIVVLATLAAACGGDDDVAAIDASHADATPPVDAIDYPAPRDDLVPSVGRTDSVDIATWNIENFPKQSFTPSVMADMITSLRLDLVAVQEIEDTTGFTELVDRLDNHHAVLSTHTYGTGEYQKIGLIYDTDILAVSDAKLIFTSDGYNFPRPPLQATVTVDDGVHPVFDFIVIAIHLKAGTDYEDRQRRKDAMVSLEHYVSQLVEGSSDDEVIVLGDFNDVLTNSQGLEVMAPWLVAADNYLIHTQALADADEVSWLPGDIILDHIVSTPALDAEFASTRARIPDLDSQYNSYEPNVSDHLPVVVSMPVLD
jgi:endonuclease/exonuclease/phosphatase family metal-dependent hydrolase